MDRLLLVSVMEVNRNSAMLRRTALSLLLRETVARGMSAQGPVPVECNCPGRAWHCFTFVDFGSRPQVVADMLR